MAVFLSESCLQTNKTTNAWITIGYTGRGEIHVENQIRDFFLQILDRTYQLWTIVSKEKKPKQQQDTNTQNHNQKSQLRQKGQIHPWEKETVLCTELICILMRRGSWTVFKAVQTYNYIHEEQNWDFPEGIHFHIKNY